MARYILQDNSGRVIRTDIKGNYVPVNSIALAEIFESPRIAKEVYMLLPKALKKVFEIKAIEEDKQTIEINKVVPDCVIKWVDRIRRCEDILKSISDTEKEVKDRTEYLNSRLSELDRQIVNIEHEIELIRNQDIMGGYQFYKKMRDVLRERREVKDELLILKELSQCEIGKNATSHLEKSAAGLQNRIYTYR